MSRIALEDGEIDLDAGRIRRAGASTSISPTEARILTVLADANGAPVDKDVLIARVWDSARGGSNTLEKAIQRLRTKVEADPRNPLHLLTVHGTGYRLVGGRKLGAQPLFGRQEVTKTLRTALQEPGARICLVGPSGAGKTALARAVTEGQRAALVDLAESYEPAEQLGAVVRGLGARPDGRTFEQVCTALGSALARRGGVLVLDNVESAPGVVAELASRWPQTKLFVTSREPMELPGGRLCELAPLEAPDAHALFLARARRDPSLADPARFARLLDELGGLPLAIELTAAWSDQLDMDELIGRIERSPSALDAVIAFSWRRLPAPARRALADLCRFRGPFDLEGAEALIRHPRPLELLQELIDRSLVRRTPPGTVCRLQIAQAVRLYARRAEPEDGATARWRTHVLRRGERRLRGPLRERAELSCDLPDLLALVREGTDEERVRAAEIALDPPSPAPQRAQLAELALESGVRLAGRAEAVARREHGLALLELGRMDEALTQAQRALGCAGEDPGLQAAALRALGRVHCGRGELALAVRHQQQAVSLLAEDERLAARTQADLAELLVRLGAPDLGLEGRARAELHRLAEADGEAALALLQARRAAEAGEAGRAEREAQAALALAREAGLQERGALAMAALGTAAWERGELKAAVRWAGEAGTALERLGALALALRVSVYEALWRAMLGENERGSRALERLAQDPSVHAAAAPFLGVIRLGQGDTEGAASALAGQQGPVAVFARGWMRGVPTPPGSGDARRLAIWLVTARPRAAP